MFLLHICSVVPRSFCFQSAMYKGWSMNKFQNCIILLIFKKYEKSEIYILYVI